MGIERKRNEAKEQEKRWLIEQQQKEQQRIEEENKRQQQYRIEQERQRQEEARRAEEERRREEEKLAEIKKENDILKQYKLFLAAKVLGYNLIGIITVTLTILTYNSATDGVWVIVPLIVFCISYYLHKAIISWLRRRIISNHLQTKKKKKEKEDRKREEEWGKYIKQRDQRDFEQIEKHRMERERQEKRMRRKNYKITRWLNKMLLK